MKKTAYFALGSLAILTALIVGIATTSAATNPKNNENNRGMRGMKATPEHRDEMQEIIDTGDYDKWSATVKEHALENGNENPRILEKINKDNFEQLKEMHDAMQSGDYEKAQEIREELGVGRRGRGNGKHNGNNRGQNRGGNFVDADGDGECDNLIK